MSDKVFLDTNILIYAYTSTEPEKGRIARRAGSLEGVIISTQVVKELCNILRKKFKLRWPEIQSTVEELVKNFPIQVTTSKTIDSAIQLADKYQFSFYDSLIIASALEASCVTLYTEDLQNGQIIEGRLTVKNPFL